ncbi:COG4315 family predicted lipoprotein [Arthrobacter sp. 35W]|uniref:COG4315 family predicted lipoprotein n=1 Tax=Arthrobacter sp. 35W TaxID=1132441 RepID=UPI000413E25E|nr:hypothetical protein [Arthrobacter sp. 35W]
MYKHSWPTLAVVVLAAAALGGCSSTTPGTGGTSSAAPSTSQATTAAPATTSPGGSTTEPMAGSAVLKTATSSLGSIVVDAAGKTVYYFDKDTAGSGASACNGACLAAWPAVVAPSDAPAVDGVTATVGTITRNDGTKQVTLNGLPIYTYTPDANAGDVKGQGFGGIWWVIAPDGDKVTGTSSGY